MLTLSIRFSVLSHHIGLAQLYAIAYQNIFTLEKCFLFENIINQIIIRQLKLYSVMSYFIITCILSLNFKTALIFYRFFFHNLYLETIVWYSCQGKQSASSEWVNTNLMFTLYSNMCIFTCAIPQMPSDLKFVLYSYSLRCGQNLLVYTHTLLGFNSVGYVDFLYISYNQ